MKGLFHWSKYTCIFTLRCIASFTAVWFLMVQSVLVLVGGGRVPVKLSRYAQTGADTTILRETHTAWFFHKFLRAYRWLRNLEELNRQFGNIKWMLSFGIHKVFSRSAKAPMVHPWPPLPSLMHIVDTASAKFPMTKSYISWMNWCRRAENEDKKKKVAKRLKLQDHYVVFFVTDMHFLDNWGFL